MCCHPCVCLRCVVVSQRDKQRKLAEKVHGSQAQVSRQRDKWKVEFYTDSGKPDMKRRDGKHMDPADFPLKDSKTVSGATADLSTLYRPMSLRDSELDLIDDEDGAVHLDRVNQLAKTVSTGYSNAR